MPHGPGGRDRNCRQNRHVHCAKQTANRTAQKTSSMLRNSAADGTDAVRPLLPAAATEMTEATVSRTLVMVMPLLLLLLPLPLDVVNAMADDDKTARARAQDTHTVCARRAF